MFDLSQEPEEGMKKDGKEKHFPLSGSHFVPLLSLSKSFPSSGV